MPAESMTPLQQALIGRTITAVAEGPGRQVNVWFSPATAKHPDAPTHADTRSHDT